MWGVADVTQDWPLIDHLWTGWLPQDMDKANQLRQLGEMYWVSGNELQVLLPAMATSPECWVDVPLLMAHAQLLADTHDSLGHCGQDKLLSTLRGSCWWTGMHADVANCIWHYSVYQWDKLPALPKEELRWMDKGSIPFIGWSNNVVGPFP